MDPMINQRINDLLIELFEIPAEKLTPDATIREGLGMDSLDAIDMIIHVEDRFNIKIGDDTLKTLVSLQDVYNVIQAKTAEVALSSVIVPRPFEPTQSVLA